jgi:hypothetical protein
MSRVVSQDKNITIILLFPSLFFFLPSSSFSYKKRKRKRKRKKKKEKGKRKKEKTRDRAYGLGNDEAIQK